MATKKPTPPKRPTPDVMLMKADVARLLDLSGDVVSYHTDAGRLVLAGLTPSGTRLYRLSDVAAFAVMRALVPGVARRRRSSPSKTRRK